LDTFSWRTFHLFAAKNAFEGCHRTNTTLAKLSENPQEKLAANLD
jgi:hypothetical protein